MGIVVNSKFSLVGVIRLSGELGTSIVQHVHFTLQGDVLDGRDAEELGGAEGGLSSSSDEWKAAQVRPLLAMQEVALFSDVARPIGACR